MSNKKQHMATKIVLSMYDFQQIGYCQSDKVRIEMIKSLIYTAPDCYGFYTKIMKELGENFQETID